jgi:integrase
VLQAAIVATQPDSRQRLRFVIAMNALAKFAGLTVDFTPLKGRYSYKKAAPRDLPNDEDVERVRQTITNPEWQRVYSLIAAYGLRPHEAFKCDRSQLPALRVAADTKTGSRLVYPICPEWADTWELQGDLPPIALEGRPNRDIGNSVSKAFQRYHCPFTAYDLRHAWAVRAIASELPVELAAIQMGHSLQVHHRLYLAWMSEDSHRQAYEAMRQRRKPSLDA